MVKSGSEANPCFLLQRGGGKILRSFSWTSISTHGSGQQRVNYSNQWPSRHDLCTRSIGCTCIGLVYLDGTGMRLLLAGGTGLIGGEVLRLGLKNGHEIMTVGRRPTGMASSEIVSSFDDLPQLPPADIAICALGTTIRQAGTQAAFRAIDEEAVSSFAKAAKAAGVDHFLVVTAVGASPDASIFYSRVKGQTEGQLMMIGFKRLDIIRPGLLLGDRKERRPIEVLLQHIAPATDLLMRGKWRRYRSVQAADAAHCLLGLAASNEPGVYIHHFDDIMKVLQSPLQDVTK